MTTLLKTHPAPERLLAFANGRLSATEMAELEAHIATCDSCCELLGKVPDDTLLLLAREAATQGIKSPGQPKAPPAPKPDPGAIPKELRDHDRYRVLGLIGTGGMGAVYKAEHRRMERLVALKVINPSLLANPQAVERFQREVRVVGKLSHQNIVAVYDADQAGDLHFLVMEFVDGLSLDRVLAHNGPLAPAQAAGFIRQAALGLQHAHEKGMVHRDIKPQNLMLTRKLQVKILDFGLVRSANERTSDVASGKSDSDESGVTTAGMILGTPDYVAPEQVTDARTADIRADIYSLGCTLYYLLTGQPPFAAGSVMEKLNAHMHSAPQSILERRSDVPAELARVLDKMMAKDPAARYQTPAEVAKALAPLAKGQGSATVASSPASTASGRREPPGTVTAPTTPAPKIEPTTNTKCCPADALVPLPNEQPSVLGASLFDDLSLDSSLPTLPPVVKPSSGSGLPFGATPQVAVLLGLGGVAAMMILAWGMTEWAFNGDKADRTAQQGTVAKHSSGTVAPAVASSPPKPSYQAAPPPTDKPLSAPTISESATPSTSGAQIGANLPRKVLLVIPSYGLWVNDYYGMKSALESRNVDMQVASVSLDYVTAKEGYDTKVKAHRLLDSNLHAKEFGAIVFSGFATEEYHPDGLAGKEARRLIDEFLSERKIVASICVGQRALDKHGVLQGKRVAGCPTLKFNDERISGTWVYAPVVEDGQIITAGADKDAPLLAEAIERYLATQ